jgi:hypothetical protein
MQLVAYGAQDIYLTGDPQITFFKVVYRRHTNFTMESVAQTFTGSQAFGGKSTVIVSRNGDLVTRALLEVDLPALTATANTSSGTGWVREVGHFLIKTVQCDIGGQQIDKHYGEWLSIWNQLTLPASKLDGYNAMIGNIATLTTEGSYTDAPNQVVTNYHGAYTVGGANTSAYHIFVPLQFWFNRNPGLALPLIALQFHEVKFQFEFRPLSDLYRGSSTGSPVLSNMELWLDYVYLDTDERRRFAKTAHEYLIEQLQYTGQESVSGSSTASSSYRLSFNHPVKFLAWVIRNPTSCTPGTYRDTLDWTDYSGTTMPATAAGVGAYAQSGDNPLGYARLVLNGHDRMTQRVGNYFRYAQPYFHWPRIPAHVINTYSFALNPAEHQPSGTCNMSRIDNATLYITGSSVLAASSVIDIFAVNYNVLRITSGMGGIAFSN